MMSATNEIWVFSERENYLPELIGGAKILARQLSTTTCCLVVGAQSMVEKSILWGADRVLWLGDPSAPPDNMRLIEDYVNTMEALAIRHTPKAFLIGASQRGRVVAGRLAARLGTCIVPDVLDIKVEEGRILNFHLMFAGGARRVEYVQQDLTIATAGLGVFEGSNEKGNPGTIEEIDFVEPEIHTTLIERKAKPPVTTNLPSAKRVLCPGRGLSKQEDLQMITELANMLQAEVGCTRPLAEGLNWLPRERYIGVSGVNLKADLYIGVGVSGQAQHTVGVSRCRMVVAINKDENAPIFKLSDYGIVGDLYEIVPSLIRALQSK